jgi:nucleoside-diphosphate-sugar epimerase
LQKAELLRELNQINSQVFVNAAGPSSVFDSLNDYDSYVDFPWRQCQAQIQLLNELNCPPVYVYISSGSVYGDTPPGGVSEDTLLNPISPYAHGKKLAEEKLVELSSTYKGRVVVLRCFSVYDYDLKARLPFIISQQLANNKSINLFGSGQELRDYIHVFDLSQAIQASVRSLNSFNVFNVGTGLGKSVEEVCKLAAQAYKIEYIANKTVIFSGESRIYDPTNLVANIEALRNLGFDPKISPEDGLLRYFKLRSLEK